MSRSACLASAAALLVTVSGGLQAAPDDALSGPGRAWQAIGFPQVLVAAPASETWRKPRRA